jgi:RND family efflux transporter MFP subunit
VKRTGRCSALLAAVTISVSCTDGALDRLDVAAPGDAISVTSVEVASEEIVEPVIGTGTIAAHKTTEVGPRVDGIIEEVFVRVGDRVAAGDPLFRTRQVDYQIRVDEAGHALRLARAEAEKARRHLERVEKLHERGVASAEQIEDVRTAETIASARFGSARSALASARQQFDDTIVRAPYDAAVTQRRIDEGVMMRTMLMGGSAVVQLMKLDIVAAIITIPESHLGRVGVGTPARIRIDGIDREYESEVLILNDRVDPSARSIELRIPIANPDLEIKAGLFARAEFLPPSRTAPVLYADAVRGVGEDRYVYVSEDGIARRRAVQVRPLSDGRLEVISGIAVGERVLVATKDAQLAQGVRVAIEDRDVAL